MQKVFTDMFIRTLTTPSGGRLEVTDFRTAGQCFRVTANARDHGPFGFVTHALGNPQGRPSDRTLSSRSSKARERAAMFRRQVANGENPVERKRRERETAASKTVAALAERYLNEHARRHKRSAEADDRNLRLHVLPKWRTRRFDEITRADVIELVESLVTAGGLRSPVGRWRVRRGRSKTVDRPTLASLVSGHEWQSGWLAPAQHNDVLAKHKDFCFQRRA